MALVELPAPGNQATGAGTTAAAADTSGTTPRMQVVVASFATIIVFWFLAIVINRGFKPTAFVIPAGVSVFAMLYAVTQGLERLLEPISSFFFSTKDHTQFRNATMAAAKNLQAAPQDEVPARLRDLTNVVATAERRYGKQVLAAFRGNNARDAVAAAYRQLTGQHMRAPNGDRGDAGHPGMTPTHSTTADAAALAPTAAATATPVSAETAVAVAAEAKQNAVKLAAAAQAELNQRRADKAIAYWALASILGMLLSATLGLYLLHIVGLSSDGLRTDGTWSGGILTPTGIRHMLDLLVTGLAVGGGTKPLHDLISNLQTAKDTKKDAAKSQ
jgi:hypothetical protein